MTERTTRAVLVVYALAAIMTFGHAFVTLEKSAQQRCKRMEVKLCMTDDIAVFGAVPSAIAWPLYWSVQLARAADAGGKENHE